MSENLDEIQAVKKIFKGISTYTGVYEAADLLTSKTVLAHGVHLEDNELVTLREKETAIIHCPTSNSFLRSGLCDVRRLMDAGIKIGLGSGAKVSFFFSKSLYDFLVICIDFNALDGKFCVNFADVAGGTSTCMLEAMRSALQVSNHIAMQKPGYVPLKYTDVFHLATLGGAKCKSVRMNKRRLI